MNPSTEIKFIYAADLKQLGSSQLEVLVGACLWFSVKFSIPFNFPEIRGNKFDLNTGPEKNENFSTLARSREQQS